MQSIGPVNKNNGARSEENGIADQTKSYNIGEQYERNMSPKTRLLSPPSLQGGLPSPRAGKVKTNPETGPGTLEMGSIGLGINTGPHAEKIKEIRKCARDIFCGKLDHAAAWDSIKQSVEDLHSKLDTLDISTLETCQAVLELLSHFKVTKDKKLEDVIAAIRKRRKAILAQINEIKGKSPADRRESDKRASKLQDLRETLRRITEQMESRDNKLVSMRKRTERVQEQIAQLEKTNEFFNGMRLSDNLVSMRQKGEIQAAIMSTYDGDYSKEYFDKRKQMILHGGRWTSQEDILVAELVSNLTEWSKDPATYSLDAEQEIIDELNLKLESQSKASNILQTRSEMLRELTAGKTLERIRRKITEMPAEDLDAREKGLKTLSQILNATQNRHPSIYAQWKQIVEEMYDEFNKAMDNHELEEQFFNITSELYPKIELQHRSGQVAQRVDELKTKNREDVISWIMEHEAELRRQAENCQEDVYAQILFGMRIDTELKLSSIKVELLSSTLYDYFMNYRTTERDRLSDTVNRIFNI